LALTSTGRAVIRITEGQIQAGSTTLNHPGVSIEILKERIADLPIDATLIDALTLSFRFNSQELRESGLSDRVQAAQQRADELVDRASKLLQPLEITRDELAWLVTEHFKKRASEK